jgi:hypothetical protein
MQSTTDDRVSQSIPSRTGITLVDLDGGPVPIWERDAPIGPPFDPDEESDPADWPAWCDNWLWEPTDDAGDGDRSIPAGAVLVPPELLDLAELGLAPIAGGGPFEPTQSDWDDYAAWAREVDARQEIEAAEDRMNPMWGYE